MRLQGAGRLWADPASVCTVITCTHVPTGVIPVTFPTPRILCSQTVNGGKTCRPGPALDRDGTYLGRNGSQTVGRSNLPAKSEQIPSRSYLVLVLNAADFEMVKG